MGDKLCEKLNMLILNTLNMFLPKSIPSVGVLMKEVGRSSFMTVTKFRKKETVCPKKNGP